MKNAGARKSKSTHPAKAKIGKKPSPAKRAAKPATAAVKPAAKSSALRGKAKVMTQTTKANPAAVKHIAGRTTKVEAPKPMRIMKREPTADEIQHKKDLAQFESAVKQMNHGNYDRAKETFLSLTKANSPDLAQKAGVFVNVCNQRLSRPVMKLKTVDDFYNHAVQMANQGKWDDAVDSLNKALKLSPDSDYLYYALASTLSLKGDIDGSLDQLQKAIEMNSKNRYLAQNDSDFDALGEDPRFTELLYPEKPMH